METNFTLLDPAHTTNKLPDVSGNYFIVLRPGCQLPSIGIEPILKKWKHGGIQYEIIYTGLGNKKDYIKFFTGKKCRKFYPAEISR